MAPCLWSPCHKQRSARFANCPYVKKKAPLVPICTKDAFAFLLLFHSCTLFQAFLSCAVHLLLRMDSNSAVHPYHQAGKLFSLLARGACYVSNRFPYAPLRIKERTSPKLSLADALVFYDLYSTQEKMICQIFFDPLAPLPQKSFVRYRHKNGRSAFLPAKYSALTKTGGKREGHYCHRIVSKRDSPGQSCRTCAIPPVN